MATKKSSTSSKAATPAKKTAPGTKATPDVKPAKTAAKSGKGDLGAETSRVAATDTAGASSGNKSVSTPEKKKPSAEDIAVHAYHKWEKRGRSHGAHHDDWHEAERELHS